MCSLAGRRTYLTYVRRVGQGKAGRSGEFPQITIVRMGVCMYVMFQVLGLGRWGKRGSGDGGVMYLYLAGEIRWWGFVLCE